MQMLGKYIVVSVPRLVRRDLVNTRLIVDRFICGFMLFGAHFFWQIRVGGLGRNLGRFFELRDFRLGGNLDGLGGYLGGF